MDIVLREHDVKRMIGEALGVKIPPDDLMVEQDPLSVTIVNAEKYLYKKKPVLRGKPDEAPSQPPDASEDSEPPPSADASPLMSMDDLKRESAGLAAAPPQTGNSENSPRALGANERTEVPPPTEHGKEKL